MKHTIVFYLIVLSELLFIPLFCFFESLISLLSSKELKLKKKFRKPIVENKLHVVVHEWGGYELIRSKSIKNGVTFECGLEFQLNRFSNYKGNLDIDFTITISDFNMHSGINRIRKKCDNIIEVSNEGMDFSGYSTFYEKIKSNKNAYVILSNSSVNSSQDNFIDNYINYMQKNPDVGILGVSYCTKIVQSFVKNNFTPHLQSFFLLTTIDVLNEIVKSNNNKFPGAGVSHKLLLIRNGEIKISQIAMKLGYNISVVLPTGDVYKFGKNNFFDNGFRRWNTIKGDIRQYINEPNKINPINNDYC